MRLPLAHQTAYYSPRESEGRHQTSRRRRLVPGENERQSPSTQAFQSGTVTVAGKASIEYSAWNSQQYLEASRLKAGEGIRKMKYAVIVEQGETSFGAHVPDLPGCIAVADTKEEVLDLIQEAIEFHIEGLREDGQPIPEPSSSVEYVEVRAA
jgi:predicted RNase H-like HicB family nuclease